MSKPSVIKSKELFHMEYDNALNYILELNP